MVSDDDAMHRASLVLRLRSMGITDHALGNAFEATPRRVYTPEIYAADAYADRLIPLPCGQTMEAPTVLAQIIRAANLSPDGTVLEIGVGSGYLSALLARLTRRVTGLERYRSLAEAARRTLERQRVSNVDVVLADGLSGWKAAAPYQAIIATGSVESLPQTWLDQLVSGGHLVAPVGPAAGPQVWVHFTKGQDGTTGQEIMGPAFAVPLETGLARAL